MRGTLMWDLCPSNIKMTGLSWEIDGMNSFWNQSEKQTLSIQPLSVTMYRVSVGPFRIQASRRFLAA